MIGNEGVVFSVVEFVDVIPFVDSVPSFDGLLSFDGVPSFDGIPSVDVVSSFGGVASVNGVPSDRVDVVVGVKGFKVVTVVVVATAQDDSGTAPEGQHFSHSLPGRL